MAFTTAAGTVNKCWLKNKGHNSESAVTTAISARMSCYEGETHLRMYLQTQETNSNLNYKRNLVDLSQEGFHITLPVIS